MFWFLQIVDRQDEYKTGDSGVSVNTWLCRSEAEIRAEFVEWFTDYAKCSVSLDVDDMRENFEEESEETWDDYFTKEGVPKFPEGLGTRQCIDVHLAALGSNEGEYVYTLVEVTGPTQVDESRDWHF